MKQKATRAAVVATVPPPLQPSSAPPRSAPAALPGSVAADAEKLLKSALHQLHRDHQRYQQPPSNKKQGALVNGARAHPNGDQHQYRGSSPRSQRVNNPQYNEMLLLSEPLNPFQKPKCRSMVIWFVNSGILFLTNQLTTLPVGFFPTFAQEKLHMTSTHLSIFFAVYPLCIMISSPLTAIATPFVGQQALMCLGLVLSGSTTIAFAYTTSVVGTFFLRVLQGIGAGAAVVTSFAVITEEFSGNVGLVLAVQEFIVAGAFITAPPIGSALFAASGIELPFLVSGTAQLVIVMLIPFLFIEYGLHDGPSIYSRSDSMAPYSQSRSSKREITFSMVLTPTCKWSLCVTTFAMAAFGFIDPYLGAHMENVLGVQHLVIGFGFALSALVYFLSTWMSMWIAKQCGYKAAILSGLLLLSIGFALLGPPPVLNRWFERHLSSLWIVQWLALVLIGYGAALSIAPSLPLSMRSVSSLPKTSQAFTVVIGLFSASIYLGQAIGPFCALLLLNILPETSMNCDHMEIDSGMINPFCLKSSLPWAFTVYALFGFLLLIAVSFQFSNASTNDISSNSSSMRKVYSRRFSLSRQASEYGQFVFLDDEEEFGDAFVNETTHLMAWQSGPPPDYSTSSTNTSSSTISVTAL